MVAAARGLLWDYDDQQNAAESYRCRSSYVRVTSFSICFDKVHRAYVYGKVNNMRRMCHSAHYYL